MHALPKKEEALNAVLQSISAIGGVHTCQKHRCLPFVQGIVFMTACRRNYELPIKGRTSILIDYHLAPKTCYHCLGHYANCLCLIVFYAQWCDKLQSSAAVSNRDSCLNGLLQPFGVDSQVTQKNWLPFYFKLLPWQIQTKTISPQCF